MQLLPEEALLQPITFIAVDGDPVTVPLSVIDDFEFKRVQSSILFGASIGTCICLFITVLITTKREKYRTPIFWINLLSLVALLVRAVLYTSIYVSPWKLLPVQFGGWIDAVSVQWQRISIATDVCSLLTFLMILLSLIFQVRVVYSANPITCRRMTIFTSSIAVLAFTFWAISLGLNIRSNIVHEPMLWSWLYLATRIIWACTITIFSAAFCAKLFVAIRKRRQLGFHKFGPIEVIFLMGVHSLVIPAILSIVEIVSIDFNGFQFLCEALLVWNLPISAIWASTLAARDHSHQQAIKQYGQRTQDRSVGALDDSDDELRTVSISSDKFNFSNAERKLAGHTDVSYGERSPV